MKRITQLTTLALSLFTQSIYAEPFEKLKEPTLPQISIEMLKKTVSRYESWVNTNQSAQFPQVITGGFRPFTSEGIGYGILFSAAVIQLCNRHLQAQLCSEKQIALAKSILNANILFLKEHMLNPKINLAHWNADASGNAEGGSATDGDFFIAQGLYLAEKNQLDTHGFSYQSYIKNILKHDFYHFNAKLILPTTGSGQPNASYPLCGHGHICIEPSKAILPFMHTLKKQLNQSGDHTIASQMQSAITSTINYMHEEQQKVHMLDRHNPYNFLLVGGDEGGASWSYATVAEPYVHLPDNADNRRFSTDTGRIPAILGGYLQYASKTEFNKGEYKTLKEVLHKLLDTYSWYYNETANGNLHYPQSIGLIINNNGEVSPLVGGYGDFNIASNVAGMYGLEAAKQSISENQRLSLKYYGCFLQQEAMVNDSTYYHQYCGNINAGNNYYFTAYRIFSELMSAQAYL